MKYFKIVLSYDGTKYHGWQRQSNTANTIQNKIEFLLSELFSQEIEVNASGRTDAGVHALMQVISFKADTQLSCSEIKYFLDLYLPKDIGIIEISPVDKNFHARISCKGKTYLYRIWNSPLPCIFNRKYVFEYSDSLNIDLMKEASQYLLGTHDFKSFCAAKKMKHSTVRTITSIDFSESNNIISIRYTGNGFLYNMVRIITGTLIDVGSGKIEPSYVEEILLSKDRSNASFTAPAKGLFLENLYY